MTLFDLEPTSTADIRGDYRYTLTRSWNPAAEKMVFVMLNPSTADANLDDPTIRRCIGFAKRDGYGGIVVVNLYAYRATDPKVMLAALDPVGPDNDEVLREIFEMKARTGSSVVAAWGANADSRRVASVLSLEPRLHFRALGLTKDGHPRHPLYVRGDAALIQFAPVGMTEEGQ